ncbi:radical SAM protein [Streptomyces sp. NPDC058701]|uniref:radical SAM protein n=1 Tax=Streptomyces sp. NPDC058701 TaxID=3346608 RepID=UPI003656836C
MSTDTIPRSIIWDITYSCPLRCSHCYSESGRRPSRQLGTNELLRLADVMAALDLESVTFAGGEPLLVPNIFEIAARVASTGAHTTLYTGGWNWRPDLPDRLEGAVRQVTVSIDGATADVHDRIRGRKGSFARAVEACVSLNEAVARRGGRGASPFAFGIDCTLTRSNFGQMEEFCSELGNRLPQMSSLSFGAAVPSGLSSRTGFSDHELLTDDQMAQLADPGLASHLNALMTHDTWVSVSDNRVLQMRPDQVATGRVPTAVQVEPDGAVRAMPIYEGTVGRLGAEPFTVLWERAVARWSHPYIVGALASAHTMAQWAEATRRLDAYFGTPEDRLRFDRRLPFTPVPTQPETGAGVG